MAVVGVLLGVGVGVVVLAIVVLSLVVVGFLVLLARVLLLLLVLLADSDVLAAQVLLELEFVYFITTKSTSIILLLINCDVDAASNWIQLSTRTFKKSVCKGYV